MSSAAELVPVALPKSLSAAPQGWRWHKLRDIAQLESGHTPSRLRPDWWGGDISWVSLTEIRALDGKWVEETQLRTNEAGIANSSARILPQGTVCFSRTASVGFVTIMAKPMATSQDFANWVCSEELDPEFLMYALIRSRSQLRAIATGATHKTIYMPELESFHVCAPARTAQERIVSTLKKELDLAETARAAATSSYREIRALRNRILSDIFAAVEAPSKVLSQHALTTSGSTPSRGVKGYWQPAEIPWVKTGEVSFSEIAQTDEAISKTALAECSLTLLPVETVLVAMYGQGKTRGQSAILRIPATTNQACFAVLPNETWEPEFLFYWFMSSYEKLRSLSADRGGNQANLNGDLLNSLKVPAPGKPQQLRLTNMIKTALAQIDALESACKIQLTEVEGMPARLLVRAFQN